MDHIIKKHKKKKQERQYFYSRNRGGYSKI
jgi:hypothetical protein